MRPQDELLMLPRTSLVLHELHPASELHPDILSRLLNVYLDTDGSRQFSRQTLVQITKDHPLIVTGSRKSPKVISGWNRLHALRLYNIDEPITCIARWRLSHSKIKETAFFDFFFNPQLEKFDDIAQRIRAISMHQKLGDDDLIDHVANDKSELTDFFNLRGRKGNTLQKDLTKEGTPIRAFIMAANKPLGAKELIKKSQPAKEEVPPEQEDEPISKQTQLERCETNSDETTHHQTDLFGFKEP
ncbi:MAG: hypothetical protein RQ867_04920 [Mariprofundaceae bacterium]|nr:hypothetical protein [Mariprofundaceae bacterium]